ncbi:MAG TPA: guanylate kinase [Polyangiaceae bacterium]|nr:guanylate kinase [Polyangiaceae bacterium]
MEERPPSPLLLIVSSPSGAGKTTLTNALRARVEGVNFSVSHTTRKPRSTEAHGREYYFVDPEEFRRLIQQDAFLEWALVHGNFYGTSRSEVERAGGCRALLFDVDYQGARQIRCAEPDAVTVFILPPDMATLEARLRGRASEDESAVQRRFQAAKVEIAHYGFFDYVLVNDDLERAIQQLIAVLLAEECRRKRGAHRAEHLLNDVRGFGGTQPPR